MKTEVYEEFGNSVYSYSRKQAIDDGVLVDVSQMAREAGFTIPVAVTDSVWIDFINWEESDTKKQTYQDSNGRLLDVLSMLRFAIPRNRDTACVFYKLYIVPRDGKTKKAKLTQLKAVIGAGDDGQPVITIMLPSED